ncbi:hypothetical protein AHAS_Ahas05G0090500 [Arachis hypogaea]
MEAMANLANTMEANAAATLQVAQSCFLKANPPAFNGSTAPAEANNWFQAVERVLQIQHVPYDKFMEYATYQLVGEAQQWWQGKRRLLHQQNMNITWALFKEAFYKKYFLESIKKARELEFLQLKQGSMTIARYTRLREDIKRIVAPLEIRGFSELVDNAAIVEDYSREVALERDEHGGTSSRGHGKYVPSRG